MSGTLHQHILVSLQVVIDLCTRHHERSRAPQICALLSAVPSVVRVVWEQSQQDESPVAFVTMAEAVLEHARVRHKDDLVVIPEVANALLLCLGSQASLAPVMPWLIWFVVRDVLSRSSQALASDYYASCNR